MDDYCSKKVRRHIIFYGSVQGVGFRWRARYAAEQYGVTGWVRNLYDGSVEMEAQGSARDIDHMIATLNSGSFISIEDMTVKEIPVEDSHWFEIR